ncbi:MAG TPA: Uma2 family endonuclease [Thermoanaerobaculia bacterium]|nr:Uma2 family endonuclease [Thermoanaerobaculia bacterium]
MTVDARLMTAEELLRMPDDGMRHELVNGEVSTMSPAGEEHGGISQEIARQLGNHVRAQRLGKVYGADVGFVLSRDPDTVRAPDAAFVRADRVVHMKEYFPGAPDLAIEVISPNDTYTEVDAKVREYLRAGSQMVVVINPRNQSATVHTANGGTHLSIDDTLDGGDVVPGWRLPLRDIFEP